MRETRRKASRARSASGAACGDARQTQSGAAETEKAGGAGQLSRRVFRRRAEGAENAPPEPALRGDGRPFLRGDLERGAVGRLGARYVQTRRLEKQLSAMHSEAFAVYGQETQAEDMLEETPAETATPMPTEAPAPTLTPAQEARQTVTPVPETVKTTQYQRMGGTPLAQMEALHAQNTDLVAWLTIDNVLDLPVVYRNNSYYLTHDFAKNKSTAGTIFLDENHPMTEKTQNLLLHGHNMKDGTMFGRLTQYEKSIDYLKAHPFVDFSTLWHQERYVIFAVVDVSLDMSSENFLDYFAHPRFSSDAEFASYIRRAELASMYAIPMDVKPSDALLTLSTCLEENRLVVIARRQRDGESKASLRETVNMAVRQ